MQDPYQHKHNTVIPGISEWLLFFSGIVTGILLYWLFGDEVVSLYWKFFE